MAKKRFTPGTCQYFASGALLFRDENDQSGMIAPCFWSYRQVTSVGVESELRDLGYENLRLSGAEVSIGRTFSTTFTTNCKINTV